MRNYPAKIAFLYLLVSICWILLSDRVILLLGPGFSEEELSFIQSCKGAFFVCFTSLLLFLSLTRSYNRLLAQTEEINKSSQDNRRLAYILENVSNMVLTTDLSNKIIWANRAFCEFTQYELYEVLGRDPSFLHKKDDDSPLIAEVQERIINQEVFTVEVINYKKSGEPYWVQLNFSPLYREDKSLEAYVTVQTVITERKMKDAQILDQNKVLQELAWINSHKLRKPVANILGIVELFEKAQPDEKSELLNLLKNSGEELDKAIQEIARKAAARL